MRVTDHFDTVEFRCHNGVAVPRAALAPLRALCVDLLEPLRAEYGVVYVISGHRTREYNAGVGGAPRSQHVYGEHGYGVAADIRCANGTPRQWHAFLDRRGAGGLGLYPAHVHVDNRRDRARW